MRREATSSTLTLPLGYHDCDVGTYKLLYTIKSSVSSFRKSNESSLRSDGRTNRNPYPSIATDAARTIDHFL